MNTSCHFSACSIEAVHRFKTSTNGKSTFISHVRGRYFVITPNTCSNSSSVLPWQLMPIVIFGSSAKRQSKTAQQVAKNVEIEIPYLMASDSIREVRSGLTASATDRGLKSEDSDG